ncbi:MAG: hypothetical protein WC565_08455 [Parcubacteria group bacterium]|jgi:hypothetical protein
MTKVLVSAQYETDEFDEFGFVRILDGKLLEVDVPAGCKLAVVRPIVVEDYKRDGERLVLIGSRDEVSVVQEVM